MEAAYKSSQEANGSAMRENEKYVQSISGHIAQLTNAWQEMWANAANRDVINFFIDAAKAVVNLANAVGVLPTTFALMLPYLNIITKVRSKDNKGIVTQFLDWANGLNEAQKAAKEMAEAQEGLNAVKEASIAINTAEAASTEAETAANAEGTAASVGKTVANEGETASTLQLAGAEVIETGAEKGSTEADIEGAGASAIKTAANLTEAGSEAAAGVDALGKIGTSITKRINLITGAISGLAHSALAIPLAIGAAITAIVAIKKIYDAHRESVFSDAKATTENIKTQQDATAQQIESYKQLKSQLDSGDLSEEETIAVKQQILDIQKSITEQYGTAAQGVDLINGKLEEQVELLNSISQKEAQDQYFKDYEGFQVAEQEYNKNNRSYNIGLNNTGNANLDKAITDELLKNGFQIQAAGMGTFNASVKGTASDGINALENTKKALEELKAEYRDKDTLEALNKQIAKIEEQIGKAYEVVDKYEATALKGLELDLAGNDTKGYDIYKNYQSSISNLESAYASGNTKKIDEAREAFEKANDAKESFLSVGNNNQFRALFDNISTSTIDTKNRVEDLRDVLELVPQDIIESYNKAKAEGDKAYKQLGEFQKVGNVDNGDRPFIFWDDKEIKKQEKAIKSWGETAENMKGSFSTVFGGSGKFDGMEIAFTPVIKGADGKGQLLSKETLYKYIDSLISEAGEGWTNEKLFALDAEGMTVDGIQISNIIADIGDTAAETGEKMHDWQSEAIGYIGDFKDIYLEALEQGMTLDEFMSSQSRLYVKNAKAANKYADKQDDIYNSAKKVKELNLDRVDVASVFESGASSSANYANAIYDLMNAMGYAEGESSVFIDDLVSLGLIQGDITDALNTASISYNDYANAISTATENLSILQNVLTESDSGKGLTDSTLDQFKKAFGDDAVKALEKTANGVRVNRDAVRELGEQQEQSLQTTHLEALNDQYTALQRVYEGYENALRNGESTTPFLQQEEAIKNEIANLELLQAEWRGTTSAYQTWVNSQSNSNPQDMYSNIVTGYETVEDLIAHGWWTDETVRSYLDLVMPDDFDAQVAGANEIKEAFEGLDDIIEGTSFSMHDFFMVGEDGKVVVDGLNNFEDALNQIQEKYYPDKNWLTYEDGNAIFDFTNGGNKEVADALGIGTELLDAIISAMESAGGYEVKLDTDDATENLETLKQDAIEAKETLNLNEKINLDPSNVEEADKSINNLNQVIESIQNDNTIDLETKTDKLKEANKILEYLVENKNQLVQSQFSNGEITLIDVSELEAADKELQKIMNRPIKGGFDFSEFDFDSVEGLEAAKNTINGMLITPNVDDSQVQYLNELLDAVQRKLDILNGVEGGTELSLSQYKALDETVTSIKQQIEEGQTAASKGFNISWSSDEEFVAMLDTLNNLDPEIKSKFGLIPDKTTEELIDMVEHGETIFVETKTKGATPAPVQDEERTVTTTENVTLGVTTIGADYANEALQQFESKDGQVYNVSIDAQANTKEANAELDEATSKGEEFGKMQPESKVKADNSQANNAIDTAKAKMNDFNGTTAWGYIRIDAGNSESVVTKISKAIDDMPTYKKVTVETVEKTTKKVGANGTAHAGGTAFSRGSIISGNASAGGNWGVPKNETALTGELGTEIVVRNGNWFTVGDNGAEFVNLKKGDIVFNHKQSKELLENGYVTSNKGRGHLVGFADGTAFYRGTMLSGSAYVGDSAKRTRTSSSISTKRVGSTSSSSSSSSKGSSNNNGNGGNNNGNHSNNNNNNNNTDKKAKETKNTLDEVEILIARIERQISNLDKRIGKTYLSWTSRNKAIRTDLKKVSKEIQDQNQAYTTYKNKAASIDLPASWKQKIANGKFKIEDVIEKAKENGDTSDSLWDKINQYKQWYEKMLAAKDAIADLTSKEAELYKQRFDNEQTYFENLIGQIEHSSTIASTLADTLEENGQLASKVFVFKQRDEEQARLRRLQQEYDNLIKRRDEAVKAGKIKKGSEMWYEMQESINGVCESIKEAEKNIASYDNAARQIDWDRWDRIHDAIDGVNNELEFLYDLLDEDKMFDEEGTITNQGITAFALLAQQYDTYFKEVQKYQNEIDATQKQLNEDPYNQNLADKLKDLKEAQQDAASNAKKMKDSMVDVTEKGIKKQIDYVKKLIDDYEDLLETQKDQTEYAKKVADQQKEINKLEKQYRAIQNDNSEEGATKRQKLRDQIEEKRQSLQETQEDRRLSETKDMLSKFEENFEDFLNNKLNNVEKIVQDVITATNNNRDTIKNTINEVSKAYGYTPSSTLQSAIDDMSKKLVSYFNSQGKFTSTDVSTITEGVNAIVKYFADAQSQSEVTATQQVAEENISHNGGTGTAVTNAKGERTIVDKNGKIKNGFYTQNGKTYYAKKGKQLKGQWLTLNNKKYYLDSTGARVTGNKYINGRYYQFDKNGVLQKKSDSKVRAEVIKSSKTHMMAHQDAKGNTVQGYYNDKGVLDADHTGWAKKGNKIYRFENGKQVFSKWVTSNGKKYYVRKDGTRASGFVTINGKTFYFADSSWKGYKDKFAGQMLTGFKTIGKYKYYFGNNGVMTKNAWQTIGKKRYYFNANGRAVTGKQTINKVKYTFNDDGSFKKKGWKKGTASVPATDLAWTNENGKAEAIIRKSDGAILTPLSKGDSVIPNNAMKNMYQALTDPAKYLKQYTMPDVKIVQSTGSNNSSPIVNMQFIANGVQDANKFANELMNNKKLEKWIQEVTLGQANGNNSFRKYNYAIR